MVNADKVKRKLPSLLSDDSITDKVIHARHNRLQYRLRQLKKKNPAKFNTLLNKLVADVSEVEKTLEDTA
jgi:hypothetical protein